MFYTDLVTVAKSCELKKSALGMNIHYVELKEFLSILETQPETVMDQFLNQRKGCMEMKKR